MTPENLHKILFVCTGNVCRSPAAEAILRHKAGEQGFGKALFLDSAGTSDEHNGEAPTNLSVLEAGRRGYDIAQLRARKIKQADFNDFDTIICMTRDHKQQLESGYDAGSANVILFHDIAPDDLPIDLIDPWGKPASAYSQMYDLLELGLKSYTNQLRQKQGV